MKIWALSYVAVISNILIFKILFSLILEFLVFRQLMVMDETHVINQMKEDVCYVSTNFNKDMETAR